ncbi:hypothetical protein [Bacterioplanoides sp.]|uniref:hypothetical protein n=1 Tax=Bacterioplanoides sp. TaxID=2066072 RepID=UPI003B00E8C8
MFANVETDKARAWLDYNLDIDRNIVNSIPKSYTDLSLNYYAIVPDGAGDFSVNDFKTGLYNPMELSIEKNSTDILLEKISDYLQDEGNCLVFDDYMADPNDDDLSERFSVSWREFFGQVYHVVDANNYTERLVRELICATNLGWYFLMLCGRKNNDGLVNGNGWSALDFIVVPAYDGEGFLVCESI